MRRWKTLVAAGGFAVVMVLASMSPVGAAAVRPLDSGPTASQLLAKVGNCTTKLTKEPLQEDEDSPRNVNVCGANGAVFYQADMDVDCDGQRTDQCNENTDCCYQDDTTFHQSDGQALNAAQLPYIVMPRDSSNWDWHQNGIDGGSVAAVIYDGKVEYAVFGDTDSPNKVGEASYATAQALGIDPDPRSGGVDDGVTYIVFSNTTADPIESHDSAVTLGQQAAQNFINNN
ncbi:glycoside hydrolase family 75 protein [Fodinicola feengrottensis]|uniref:Glycoside hydrolase family 75 protein n=1 Tax=Fodinicola feengrottensis TaxID=435914 RepID=A0ABN2FZE5_9ACTN